MKRSQSTHSPPAAKIVMKATTKKLGAAGAKFMLMTEGLDPGGGSANTDLYTVNIGVAGIAST